LARRGFALIEKADRVESGAILLLGVGESSTPTTCPRLIPRGWGENGHAAALDSSGLEPSGHRLHQPATARHQRGNDASEERRYSRFSGGRRLAARPRARPGTCFGRPESPEAIVCILRSGCLMPGSANTRSVDPALKSNYLLENRKRSHPRSDEFVRLRREQLQLVWGLSRDAGFRRGRGLRRSRLAGLGGRSLSFSRARNHSARAPTVIGPVSCCLRRAAPYPRSGEARARRGAGGVSEPPHAMREHSNGVHVLLRRRRNAAPDVRDAPSANVRCRRPRFHNSVHNAAAGYWSIATRSREASTASAPMTRASAPG